MSVRVIVVNWNGRRWLDGCFTALGQQDRPATELVLVDNGSTDDSVSHMRAAFPGVRIVAIDRNLGFAGGNNAGARDAATEFLAFLNNDTQADAGWLGALVAAIASDPGIGLVTSRIVYMDAPDRVDSAGDGYLRAGGAFKHAHGGPVDRAGSSREVFGACGAAFVIRRTLFEALGGFDEDFFMVYEDVDLSYRARLLGWRVMYAHEAVVRHAGSASMGRASNVAVFYGQRNLEWTWLKNSPGPLLWRSVPGHVLYDLAGCAAYARRGQLGPWLRGKWAAMLGIPRMLVKRRDLQRSRRADPEQLWGLMDADWIRVKRREKQFDFAIPTARRSG